MAKYSSAMFLIAVMVLACHYGIAGARKGSSSSIDIHIHFKLLFFHVFLNCNNNCMIFGSVADDGGKGKPDYCLVGPCCIYPFCTIPTPPPTKSHDADAIAVAILAPSPAPTHQWDE
jgi:hypothetical protein